MTERKTLHITLTAGPYGDETPVSVREDIEERGIAEADVIEGVKLIGRGELGTFIESFDTVWNW